MNKTFALAEVKTVDTKEPAGEFEAVLSAATLDRDGEVIDKGAFEPLPTSVPIHAFHDFSDPIGRAVPFYDGDVLKVRGYYASTARAQEIRQLVAEGVIGSMSVGFMAADRTEKDGVPHITSAEILEGSFVSVPSNREAAVLMAKSYAAKAGARNSSSDAQRLQQIHDLAVTNGATCEAKNEPTEDDESGNGKTASADPEEKAAAPAAADPPADVVAMPDTVRARVALAEATLLLTS